jgi:hypothetical protein
MDFPEDEPEQISLHKKMVGTDLPNEGSTGSLNADPSVSSMALENYDHMEPIKF